jgi:YD repeat-containing protein
VAAIAPDRPPPVRSRRWPILAIFILAWAAAGSGITYSVDRSGRLDSMTDGNGATAYGYNEVGKVTSVTRAGRTSGYAYDDAGRVSSVTYPAAGGSGDYDYSITGVIGYDPIAGIHLSDAERAIAIGSALLVGGGMHLLSRLGDDVADASRLGRARGAGTGARVGGEPGSRIGRSALRPSDDIGAQRVLFGQRRVSRRFSSNDKVPAEFRGRTLDAVAGDLRSGRLSANDVPIQAFIHEGQLVSANTRSLTVLSMAGLQPTQVSLITPTDKMLTRLSEAPLVPGASLPGTSVAITPSRSDLTILRVVNLP